MTPKKFKGCRAYSEGRDTTMSADVTDNLDFEISEDGETVTWRNYGGVGVEFTSNQFTDWLDWMKSETESQRLKFKLKKDEE